MFEQQGYLFLQSYLEKQHKLSSCQIYSKETTTFPLLRQDTGSWDNSATSRKDVYVAPPCFSAVKSLVYTLHKRFDIFGSLSLSPLELMG